MTITGVEGGGIGQPVLRKEDHRLITGRGRYTLDKDLPGQAHAVIVRSPHAHARLVSVDAAPARAAPGVVAVLTGADMAPDGVGTLPCYSAIPGLVDLPLNNSDGSDKRTTPLPLLATEKVRFVGDPVVAVIAETAAAAADAAELVGVIYEPLDSVTATPRALDVDAPLVWDDTPDNKCVDAGFGDEAATQAAFAGADHVARLNTWVQRVTGVMMETRSALCDYDAAAERFTLYCGCDNSVRVKRDIAKVFGVAEDRVRVVAEDVGGNFGTRNWTYPEYGIACWASRKIGRPVKWAAQRSEAFLSDYQGRDLAVDAALALNRHGDIVGLRGSLLSNLGAFTVSFVPLNKTSELLTGVYDIPVAHLRSRGTLSNTSPTAPYRSAGRPEAMFIIERLIDTAAREFGFDPVELRRRNLIGEAAMPYRTALGLTYDSGAYERAMDKALELGDWAGFPTRREEARARGRLRGIGLANYIEITSGFPLERAEIDVKPDGSVDVVIGTTSSGQGHETSFAQCIVEWLGVPFESVRMITGDTDIVKEGGGSHSARSMRMAGIVMGAASDTIIEKGMRIAGHLLEAAETDLVFSKGMFRIEGTDRAVGIFEVAAAARERTDLPEDLRGPFGAEHQELMQAPGFPYGAQVCEVEIDPDTGTLEVIAYTAVDDVGRAVNPLILHGQTHGGIAQGAGQALMEHAFYDSETGQMLAASLMDYALPRADNFPSFVTDIMEVPSPTNKLGVRGGGEGGATPALGVVINAIVDALAEFGVDHLEMPATPECIWRAINRNA